MAAMALSPMRGPSGPRPSPTSPPRPASPPRRSRARCPIPAGCNAATRERIERPPANSNYIPNTQARALTSGRTRAIAVLVSDVTNPFYFGIIRGTQQQLKAAGYTQLLVDTEESDELEDGMLHKLRRSFDGAILAASRLTDRRLTALAARVPLVAINRQTRGVPSVFIDTPSADRAGRRAPGLARAPGHRLRLRPGDVLVERRPLAGDASRRREARRARRCGSARSRPRQTPAPPPPTRSLHAGATACVAFNDLLAIGMLTRLRERGVRVPGDISIVGCDDIFGADFCNPPLTTLTAPIEQAGRVAVSMLLSPCWTSPSRAGRAAGGDAADAPHRAGSSDRRPDADRTEKGTPRMTRSPRTPTACSRPTRASATSPAGCTRGARRRPSCSPHGHVDAAMLADDEPFPDPAALLITPDHYVTRLLHAVGVPLDELGLARDGRPPTRSGREIWRAALRALGRLPRHAGAVLVRDGVQRGVRADRAAVAANADELYDQLDGDARAPRVPAAGAVRPVPDRGAGDHRRPRRRPGGARAARRRSRLRRAGAARPSARTGTCTRTSRAGPERLARLAAAADIDTGTYAGLLAALRAPPGGLRRGGRDRDRHRRARRRERAARRGRGRAHPPVRPRRHGHRGRGASPTGATCSTGSPRCPPRTGSSCSCTRA